ncbi:hypothetical protein BJX96DRAFT_147860 [Aspergillus floccosus]
MCWTLLVARIPTCIATCTGAVICTSTMDLSRRDVSRARIPTVASRCRWLVRDKLSVDRHGRLRTIPELIMHRDTYGQSGVWPFFELPCWVIVNCLVC